jgi:hypothetical protein
MARAREIIDIRRPRRQNRLRAQLAPFGQRLRQEDFHMLHRISLGAIFVVFAPMWTDLQAVPLPKDNRRPNCTVMPGSWTWTLETNKVGNPVESSDLWWSHNGRTERSLQASNGSAITVVAEPFEKIDLKYLKSVQITNDKVSGSDNNNCLKPGTVMAVRTANGNFAKIKVVRYYQMHDFKFAGSEVLTENMRVSMLKEPNQENYHIEFEWFFFKCK